MQRGDLMFLWWSFCSLGLVFPSEERFFCNYKLDWDDHFYPMMTHFDPAGSGLFQHDSVRFYRAHGVSGWFDYYEKWCESSATAFTVNRSQPNLTPMGDLGSTPTSKHQVREYLLEEWCSKPFNRVSESWKINVKVDF